MDEHVATVMQRLDRLEWENRWLKRVGGLTLVGLAAVVLMGQAVPGKVAKVVEAEAFILRDPSGNERGKLAVGAKGPFLGLLHEGGQVGAMLDVQSSGPVIGLYRKDEKSYANLSALSLRLFDEEGRLRAVLGQTAVEAIRTGTVEQRPASSIVLFDKDGKVLWMAP